MSDIIYIKDFSEIEKLLQENNTQRKRNKTKIRFKCCKCRKETSMALGRFLCRNELVCKKCKTKTTSLEQYGVEHPTQSKDVREKIMKTNLERYGVEHPAQSEEVRKKMKKTNLERYGVENAFQNEHVKEKFKKTNLERYGVENPAQSEEVKDKAKKTNLERYGVQNPSQLDAIKEKKRQTCLKHFGVECSMQSSIVKDKAKKTNLERYGVEHPAQSEVIRGKFKKTNLERYGVEHPSQLDAIKEKKRQTCLKHFGVEYPNQNPEVHKKIFSHRKEKLGGYLSMSEKKFAEMLKNRKIDFEYDFYYNGKNWDFKVSDILVEIDGEYYHGLLSDSDGKHVQGQNDCERPKLAEPYRFLAIDSLNIEKGISELMVMIGIDYEQWIQNIKDSLPKEFPYPSYDNERMLNDWKKLCKYDWNKGQRLGMSIVNNFHKSIWTSHVGNKPSPVEAWNDEELLDKCVRNRFIYKSVLSSQNIAQGFNVCKIAPKVSVFNPSLARHLVETYLGDFTEIFDPFSGFSGRMLGVCSLGKKYIGQDISETAIKESEEIKNFLGLDADLYCKDVLNSHGEYDCLFTCSPYGLKEIWCDDIENKSCDEWIDECLKRFKCKKYLFIVDSTEKYKDCIIETIENNSHFGKNKEYVVLIG